MTTNTNDPQDDDQNDYLSKTINDQPEDADDVDNTDLEKIADQMVGDDSLQTDSDIVSLTDSEEEDDGEHNEIGDLVHPGVDEGEE